MKLLISLKFNENYEKHVKNIDHIKILLDLL